MIDLRGLNKIVPAIVNTVSVLTGVLLLINFVVWSSLSTGFDLGFELATGTRATTISFSGGPRTYQLLSDSYETLAYLSIAVVLLSLLTWRNSQALTNMFLRIITVILLATAAFELRWLLGLKDPSLNDVLTREYNSLALRSAFWDEVALVATAILLTLNAIAAVISGPFRWKRDDSRLESKSLS